MAMAGQPITYAFDMLATFPLSLARWEALLLSSEGRLAAGVGTQPEGVGVSSFWREGLGLGISFQFGKGKAMGRERRLAGRRAAAERGIRAFSSRPPRLRNLTVARQ